jgi:hypothetical protein
LSGQQHAQGCRASARKAAGQACARLPGKRAQGCRQARALLLFQYYDQFPQAVYIMLQFAIYIFILLNQIETGRSAECARKLNKSGVRNIKFYHSNPVEIGQNNQIETGRSAEYTRVLNKFKHVWKSGRNWARLPSKAAKLVEVRNTRAY